MQIHGPSDEADGSTFTARLNTTGDEPFAVVQMGHVHFYAHTSDECDAAIRVWTEAKQLLLAARTPEQDEPLCDDPSCVLDDDHDVSHMDESGRRWPRTIAGDSGPEQVTS